MELGGGIVLGIVLMFSLLAFAPEQDSPLSRWFAREWAAIQASQTASVSRTLAPMETEKKAALLLASPSFAHGGALPARFTCDGAPPAGGVSPELLITGVPKEAQSLVVLMEDPDASTGTWVHWLVFNIPPTTRILSEGREPVGYGGNNSWGKTGYGGPCPPPPAGGSGEHHYFFHLYALNKTLALKGGSTKEAVLAAMKGSVLAEAELMGRYKRAKK